NLHHIKQISCGGDHSLVLNEDGQVFSFGTNKCGQLGLGHNKDSNIPELIPNLHHIKQISCGGDHSLVLNEVGQVSRMDISGSEKQVPENDTGPPIQGSNSTKELIQPIPSKDPPQPTSNKQSLKKTYLQALLN